MARSRIRPEPPRISEPDVAEDLVEATLTRSGEVRDARIALPPGSTDAAHSRLDGSIIASGAVDSLDLSGAILSDVAVDGLSAVEVIARDSTWRTVVIRGGRIGTLDLSRARMDGVLLDGVRVEYLSLSAAVLLDVEITGCRIGTLDAPGARLERVRITESQVEEFDSRELQLRDLDLRGLDALSFTDIRALRGATLTDAQVAAHARALAIAVGIDVQD